MKKNIIHLLLGGALLSLGIANLNFAQITVTADDAPSTPGIFFEMSAKDTVQVDLGQPGVDQHWDFSNISFSYKSYWRVIDYNKAPLIHRFPDANLVYQVTYDEHDTITYNFARITATDLTELGQGKLVITGTDTIVTLVAVGKRVTPRLRLPATFGDHEWSSVFELDTTLFGFAVTVLDSSNNRIDGWGTIKTSFGEFPCLRVRQDHFRYAFSLFATIPLEININYFWITNDYGILATVTGMSDITKPNPDPNYTIAKSIDIMTNFRSTSVERIAGEKIPKEFNLFQNYPNPFNPKTTIGYQLNEPSEVTLKIFNIVGQQIAILVRERQQPGKYELEWNATSLPSGIYYYQIRANQNLLTKECLLLK
jgi:hypothetical protein